MLLLAVILSGCLHFGPKVTPLRVPPETLGPIAVIVSDDAHGSRLTGPATVRRVEAAFTQSLVGKQYRVASRSDVEQLIEELRFQHTSGYTDRDAVEVGRMLNVSHVLLVSITGNEMSQERKRREDSEGRISWTTFYTTVGSVHARLLDVRTREIQWEGNHRTRRYSSDQARSREALFSASRGLAAAFPDRYPEETG